MGLQENCFAFLERLASPLARPVRLAGSSFGAQALNCTQTLHAFLAANIEIFLEIFCLL